MRNCKLFKRLLSVVLVLCMVSAWVMPAGAAAPGIRWNQVSNDRVSANLLGKDSVELGNQEPEYADSDVVRVSIFLEKAGVLDAGFPVKDLAENAEAMAYRGQLEQEQETMVQRIEKAIAGELDVVWHLTLASNLISANVRYGQIAAIEQVGGVRKVVIETVYEPQKTETANPNTATSGNQIGVSGPYAAGYTGAGTRIAVIDTGLDLLHQSFDADAYLYALEQQAQAAGKTLEQYVTGLNLLDAEEIASVLDQLNVMERMNVSAEDLYINEKIPFGFNYIDKNLNVEHMQDNAGDHGSHVSGIAAANSYIPKNGAYVKALEEVFAQGVAPEAQVIVMKVFGAGGGAYQADYVAAMEDAILLNVDAINLSLGGGNPGLSYSSTAEYQAIFDSLDKSGVVVSISAGNAGAWMDEVQIGAPYLYLDDVSMQTSGSPGTYTNSLGVASVDNAGIVGYYLSVDGNKVAYTETLVDNNGIAYGNTSLIDIAGTHEYVFLNGVGTAEEFAALGQDALKGKIALCFRGEISFYEKANAAVTAGAAAVLIVNNQPGTVYLNLTGYSHTAPVVSLTDADSEIFKTNAVTDNNGEVLYWTGTVEVSDHVAAIMSNNNYYTMSSFSSWGVPANLILKPEITAPGGNILSIAGAYYGGTEDHASYVSYSGTSMAAPHVAGMAALVAQYIRENDLAAKTGLSARTLAQSLLMSTAEPICDGDNGFYYPVLQQGAGLANVANAITADSYILMHEDATASYADGKVKVELLDDPERKGSYSFSFTLYNLTGEAKQFALSADFFTQNILEMSGVQLLDTKTMELTPIVTFLVDGNGQEGDETMAGMDFNGDGAVNSADGQALLDHVTGKIASISNENSADLDGNGKITSYDAYLFFRQLGASGVKLAGNGQAKITVEVNLSIADKEWLSQYENGAYLQAYVYAESEGGTSHSIPVLGFYGNWTDASMYDKGSYEDYFLSGEETRVPYLYEKVYQQGIMNGLVMTYGDDPEHEYYFGGNPIVPDEVYMPQRNAINGVRGDMISSVTYTCIRNAVGGLIWVKDANGQILDSADFGWTPSAYYHVNSGEWKYTYWDDPIGYVPDVLENNTQIEVGITLAPEYYQDAAGNINWEALGKGTDLSMMMVVDNTAPVVNSVELNKDNNELMVNLLDNQYIAAVVLLNDTGDYVYLKEGSQMDAQAGVATEYVLDVSEVNGASFLLQVYDYAMNCTTYEITTQIGEVTDEVDAVVMSETNVMLQLDQTYQLSASVLPVNTINRDVVWTSQNSRVATVDENGLVTAHDVGRTRIVATSAANGKVKAYCMVEVIDVAADLNSILWDENGDIWLTEFNTADLKNYTHLHENALDGDEFIAATMGPDGTLYLSSMNSSTGKGALYILDEDTYEPVKLTDCLIQGRNGPLHIFFSDLTYVPAMFGTGALLGTYGPYVIAMDPETGETIGAIDSFEDENGDYVYLLGIAGSYGTYTKVGSTWVYQDYVYIITENGEIIVESYYGYEKNGKALVAPYSYVADEPREVYETSVDTGEAWYYNSAYYDGEHLYWAAFDQDTDDRVTMYAFDESYAEYNLGDFGKDVWPVCGLYKDAAELETNRVQQNHELLYIDADAMQMHEVQKVEVKKNEAAMQLQTLSQNSEKTAEAAETIRVDITAKDADGKGVSSTNGTVTVTYDASKLTLKNIEVQGNYVSIVEKEGSVTFAYVALGGLAADDAVATLEFEAKTADVSTVNITFKEVNNTEPDFKEAIAVACPHGKTEVRNTKAPTCTEPGYSGDLYCTSCGKLVENGKTVEPTGHTYENGKCVNCGECKHDNIEILPGKAATCTEPGLTEGKKCVDCGETLVAQETIPSLGHTEEILPGKAATCTEPGLTEGKKCSVCGETLVAQETIPSLGHTEEVLPGKAATCTESGLTEGKKCSVCGETLVAQEQIPAKGHSYGVWYVENAATCTEDGNMRHDCQNCDFYETGLIPATGHNEVVVPGKAATCTEPGLTEGKKCSVCGEILVAQEEIPAKGHNYENGSCTDCGEKDPDSVVVIGLLGDINGDGIVNSSDVSILFRYVSRDATLGALTAEQLLLADVNQDGTVNSSDVSILFRYVSRDATLAWEPNEITN